MTPGGGAHRTQIRFRQAEVQLKRPNQYLSLRVILIGKGYLLLRVFSQEIHVFVYFSDRMGENYKSGGYV